MAAIRPTAGGKGVFLNVPFDSGYEKLFVALIASVVAARLVPRCAVCKRRSKSAAGWRSNSAAPGAQLTVVGPGGQASEAARVRQRVKSSRRAGFEPPARALLRSTIPGSRGSVGNGRSVLEPPLGIGQPIALAIGFQDMHPMG
jgi:hypothetical protein